MVSHSKKDVKLPNDIPLLPCTCGRGAYDHTELAVILEEDGQSYAPKSRGSFPSKRSLVVCIRKGCFGKYRSAKMYVAKLPRIFGNDYAKQKKQERLEMEESV